MAENERIDKPLPPPSMEPEPPALPPKVSDMKAPELPNLPLGSLSTLHSDFSLPPPSAPMSPASPAAEGKKKPNPLTDLIDTENAYVELLTAIIRKVAAAWSRSNLPPSELDIMFRSIESIYKANKSLLSRLKDIGTNPSSPKALGDLLMRWIEELGTPYEKYATKYCCGFDSWEPVSRNPKLPGILATLSSNIPPPNSVASGQWTLDDLFLLPKTRIKYYRKLYARLLKNTSSGRSDHRLLAGAVEKLEGLTAILDSRSDTQVAPPVPSSPPQEPLQEDVVIDLRTQSVIANVNTTTVSASSPPPLPPALPDALPALQPISAPKSDVESERSSARGSGVSEPEVRPPSSTTSFSRPGSSNTLSAPITDLERRLATERTLDIFTMKPKVVRLQMSPPTLTFKRELRCSFDVVIRFTPRATGQEWVHQRGHIFLLSDLFLVCEKMTPEERSESGVDGPDMWLSYPPLAGKVLRVAETPGTDNVLEVAVMRKETIYIHTDNLQMRNSLLAEFRECIDFASSLPPPNKELPPPVPPLKASLTQDRERPSRATPPAQLPPRMSSRASDPIQAPQNDAFAPGPTPSGSPPFQGSNGLSLGRPIGPGEVIPNANFGAPQPVQAPLPQVGGIMPHSFTQNFGPPRPPSEPGRPPLRGSPSTRSLNLPNERGIPSPPNAPPVPMGHPMPGVPFHMNRPPGPPGPPPGGQYPHPNHFPPGPPGPFPNGSPGPNGGLSIPQLRPMLPSMQHPGSRAVSMADAFDQPSPPDSPVEETPRHTGPVRSTISAQMKCKVFLKQHHAQWKSLGSARLKLYKEEPTNVKQLVVEADSRNNTVLISTIILTDGVERVGKTGVAIELSDKGARTGIVYMLQLRNETSAGGLFDSLIAGSDRSGVA